METCHILHTGIASGTAQRSEIKTAWDSLGFRESKHQHHQHPIHASQPDLFLPTFFCPKLLPPQLRWYRPHVHPPSSEAWLRLGDPSLKMCPRKICIASVKTADTAYKRRLVTGRPISWIYHLMISYIWMYLMDISYDTLCILWMYLGRYSMSPTQTLAASISYIWPRCLSTTTPCIPASLVICCTFCEGPSLRLALNKCLPSHFPSEVPIK